MCVCVWQAKLHEQIFKYQMRKWVRACKTQQNTILRHSFFRFSSFHSGSPSMLAARPCHAQYVPTFIPFVNYTTKSIIHNTLLVCCAHNRDWNTHANNSTRFYMPGTLATMRLCARAPRSMSVHAFNCPTQLCRNKRWNENKSKWMGSSLMHFNCTVEDQS